MKNLGLIPLRNFACIDEDKGVYRSAQPSYDYEYRWLGEQLKVDIIINLRSESRHDDEFAPRYNMEVRNIDIIDHRVPTIKQAQDFINCIKVCIDKGLNVLIHCQHGHGRTSTFCVLARLAMGWTLYDAIKEEEDFFHYEFKHYVQKEFLIKNFSDYNNDKTTNTR